MIKIRYDEEFEEELSEREKVDQALDDELIDAEEAGFMKGFLNEED